MDVFISWSGEKSKQVAELLDEWLRCVIQSIKPWISTEDMAPGSIWFPEIANQLNSSTMGIVCLTKENKDRPWILFETGALAMGLSSANKVFTFLIDLEPEDIGDPLAQFNHTFPKEKKSMKKLIHTINNSNSDNKLDDKILDKIFEKYWPDFEKPFNSINKDFPISEGNERTQDDKLTELLYRTRNMERRIRTIESNNNENNSHQDVRMSVDMARSRIRRMLRDSIPEGAIIDYMVNKGVPEQLIIHELNTYRHMIKDNNDMDSDESNKDK